MSRINFPVIFAFVNNKRLWKKPLGDATQQRWQYYLMAQTQLAFNDLPTLLVHLTPFVSNMDFLVMSKKNKKWNLPPNGRRLAKIVVLS